MDHECDTGTTESCINCRAELGDDGARVHIPGVPMLGTPNLCGRCIAAPGYQFSGVEILERLTPTPEPDQ